MHGKQRWIYEGRRSRAARGWRRGSAWGLLASGILACGGGGAPASSDTASGPASEILATVGGEPVTLADVRQRVGDELDRMEADFRRSRYRTIEGSLQEILTERLLRAEMEERGRTLDELVEDEATGRLEPTDEEVAAWYEENGERLRGRPLEDSRAQIANYIEAQRRQETRERLESRLRESGKVRIHLEPYRVTLDNAGAPARGDPDAPITLVEFSDFQCPFCVRFTATVEEVMHEFGDTVRVVFRHFPLTNIHANAERAAEAAFCAGEQGRFWEMHDLLFQEQDRLGAADLVEKARRLALDGGAFDACMESGRAAERIRTDQREGRRVAVGGTPAAFVNGIPVEGGAVPFETLEAVIGEELRLLR